jgi:PAS domain S-box-containing protein
MKSSKIMTLDLELSRVIIANPLKVSSETSLAEVIALMSQTGGHCHCPSTNILDNSELLDTIQASCVLVFEEDRLVGIFTERDVVRLSSGVVSFSDLKIKDVMTRSVIALQQSQFQNIFSILRLFQQHNIRHLPILDGEQLVGLLTPESVRKLLQPADLLQLRPVSEVMTKQVIYACSTTSVLDVTRLMAENRVSCVVIVDNSKQNCTEIKQEQPNDDRVYPVGIITERDIVQFQALGLDFEKIKADAIMSTPPFCVSPNDALWAAHQTMEQRWIHRLVVTGDREELVGILTQTSLLKAIDPTELYTLVDLLQQKVNQLEAEKLELLENRNAQLEKQVRERTSELFKKKQSDRLLSSLSNRIRKSFDLPDILQTTVTEARDYLQADRVIICKFEPDWQGQIVASSVVSGWKSLLGEVVDDPCFATAWVEPYTNGRIRAVSDIYTANYTPCHIALLVQLQIRAKLIVPIIQSGKLWGLLSAHGCQFPRQWKNSEIDLLEKLANQVAIAIQQAELYQQTQVELTERHKVEEALEREQKFASAILDVVGALVMVLDRQGNVVRFNQTCEYLTGYCFDEVKGKQIWDLLFIPEEVEAVKTVFQRLTTGQFPICAENYWVTKDGNRRSIAWSNTVLMNDQNIAEYIIATGIDITERKQAEEDLRRSEEQRRLALDLTGISCWDWQFSDESLSWSGNTSQLLGLPANEGVITYQNWWESIHPEDIDWVERAIDCSLRNHTDYEAEYRITYPNGNLHWLFEKGRAIYDESNQPTRMLGVLMDVTDRKQAETALTNLVEGTAAAVGEDFFPLLVRHLSSTLNVRHVCISKLVEEKLQTQAFWSENQLQPNIVYDPSLTPCELVLKQGIYVHCERVQENFPDDRFLVDLQAESYWGIALFDTAGTPIGVLCILDDKPLVDRSSNEAILRVFAARAAAELERQQALEALQKLNQELEVRIEKRTADLRESEARFRVMADSAPVLIWVSNTEGLCNFLNQGWLNFTGRTLAEEIGNGWLEDLHTEDLDRFLDIYISNFNNKKNFQIEYRLRRVDGQYRWILNTGTPRFSPDGNFAGYIGSCIDISDRKIAEEKIKISLAEKELLLKEVHHRVKNNLQVISSIFALQSQCIKDPNILAILTDSQSRIRSMALIHEKLYQSDNLAQIDFPDYIQNLVSNLFSSYNINAESIKSQIQLENISLDIDAAIPCGLLINELVSNSLKHAFPSRRSGTISISFLSQSEDLLSLVVRDDGVGLPEGLEIEKNNSLGLRLVRALTRQLQGKLKIDSDNGTRFEILFPKKEKTLVNN